MKKWLICIITITFLIVGVSCCKVNSSSAPLVVQMVKNGESAELDSNATGKILALFDKGTWIEATPNCSYDFLFHYNGDVYRYHSDCGTFYSLTDEQSLKLSETSKTEVNNILKVLFS